MPASAPSVRAKFLSLDGANHRPLSQLLTRSRASSCLIANGSTADGLIWRSVPVSATICWPQNGQPPACWARSNVNWAPQLVHFATCASSTGASSRPRSRASYRSYSTISIG